MRRTSENNPHEGDPQLLELLKQGDSLAFQTIYVQWRKPLFMFLYKLTLSEDDADDITQEVFITLWETRERLDPGKGIKAYIYLLARQSAYKLFRRQRVEEGYLANSEFSFDEHINSLDIIVARETELLAELAISKMPEQRRRVYQLSYREGLTNAEIADQLNIPRENVKHHLHEARKQLKKLIALSFLLFLMH
ncbi:RNA polymerase sigma factor [Bacteroides sp. 224]|uniref:RNA polymerase sigma factor n=1 Tax=Bacteroides sp. 224 TaxID=2302936 RepID=UPI0013D4B464|nr:sigma-70 family RNA polymerase sigma factor [Bacteroides sp. 224]NDV64242.1 sigma-70 family RNA polymerase sigma factor [Bacteroides sp. 224]